MPIHYSDKLNPRGCSDDTPIVCSDGRNPVITLDYLSSLRRCNPFGRRGSYLFDVLRNVSQDIQLRNEGEEEELVE